MPHLSVIICTHNPRPNYFERVLDALRQQSLATADWELLVIDNQSTPPLAERYGDQAWHPAFRIIRELELGLTPARLRGIREATGELLVFVDDDNLLDPEYLARCLEIARRHPWIGAFGGSTIGEYEEEPAESVRFMLPQLAVREIEAPSWACQPGVQAMHSAPCGAGMAIRRSVAVSYAEKVASDPLRRKLDRVGTSLSSAGDSDMAFCACELGLAVGVFPELVLKHLIPAGRLQRDYLIRLAEGMSLSHAMLKYVWERKTPPPPGNPSRAERIFEGYKKFRSRMRGPTLREEVQDAVLRGREQARAALKSL